MSLRPRAIVLFGSRAGQSGISTDGFGDYDIVVVTPTLCTPFAVRPLRKVQADLETEFNAAVSLNPAPALRLRRPSGNYMLLKLAREGVVISGPDVMAAARGINPAAVAPFWHFFYLASQAKRLLGHVPPRPARHPETTDDVRRRAYAAAKAIIAIAEVLVLAESGAWQVQPAPLAVVLAARGRTGDAGLVNRAAVWDSGAVTPGSSSELWWAAHKFLLDTVGSLARRHCGSSFASSAFERTYLKSAGWVRLLRDVQFTALSLVGSRQLRLRALADRRGAAERVKLAAFLVLASLQPEGGKPDPAMLKQARRLISGLVSLPREAASQAEFDALNRAIHSIFPYACVALGV